MTPEERDDAAQGPEANDSPESEEGQEQQAAPGEPGEATPDEPAAESAEPPEAEQPEEPEPDTPEEPAADQAEEPVAEEPTPEDGADASPELPRPKRGGREKSGSDEELIPGAHLEPDLVLEEEKRPPSEFGEYDEVEGAGDEEAGDEEPGAGAAAETGAEPLVREPLALAADARYAATGKRKSAVARVILRPGEGTYTINSRHLDEYFPRIRLQRMARQPLEAAGYQNRMDVVARIHGGGVAAQASALRHGVARALVEADPALRGELKRRGYLTRDPRVKERKKAGLKKARKRPQFSKR